MGWDVETAIDAGLTGKIDDTIWVIYARKNYRIPITFDELSAEQGERVSQELRLNGGRVLRLQGGPEQDKYRAIGKLLFHYPEWYPFLSEGDGVSVISDIRKQSCKNYTPEEYHHKHHKLDAVQFDGYLEGLKQKRLTRKKRKRKPPPSEQLHLSKSD